MGKILGLDGKEVNPQQLSAEQIFNAMATKKTQERRAFLRKSVKLPKHPTPEQIAYKKTVVKQLDIVALDFYLMGVRDFKIRQMEEFRKAALDRAAMRAIQVDPKGKNSGKPNA